MSASHRPQMQQQPQVTTLARKPVHRATMAAVAAATQAGCPYLPPPAPTAASTAGADLAGAAQGDAKGIQPLLAERQAPTALTQLRRAEPAAGKVARAATPNVVLVLGRVHCYLLLLLHLYVYGDKGMLDRVRRGNDRAAGT